MEATLSEIFPANAAFDATSDDTWFDRVPAKACVALFLDAGSRPLQLVCTRNLRAMLRRRLGAADPSEPATPGKRVNYRELVRGIAWRRVDSDFEMDCVYIEAARVAFPSHWRRLIPDRVAHFVAIDASHQHPDFVRTTDPTSTNGTVVFGPFPDRAKADRWIETARDAFDLCRYRTILAQAPNGRACSYKQMNKCPAPCDGTVELSIYRQGVSKAVGSIRSPSAFAAELAEAMKGHAGRLEFEHAGRVKARMATFAQLGEGPNQGVRTIESFRFVTVQPGPRKNTAKIFAIASNAITEVAAVAAAADYTELQSIFDRPTPPSPWPAEVLVGLVCFHLAGAKTRHRFAATSELTSAAFDALVADAMKPRAAKEDAGDAIRETRIEA